MPPAPLPSQGETRRVMFQSPPTTPAGQSWWDPDESLPSATYPSGNDGSSPPIVPSDDDAEEAEDEDGHEEEEEDAYEEGEEEEAASTTSSEMYDRDADPEAYATRLDELAGVLEMGQVESQALKWGPAMGRQREAPKLSMGEFKELINHHLASTEWQFNPPADLFPPLPGRGGFAGGNTIGGMLPSSLDEGIHPIRVLGVDVLGHGIGAEDMEGLSLGDM